MTTEAAKLAEALRKTTGCGCPTPYTTATNSFIRDSDCDRCRLLAAYDASLQSQAAEQPASDGRKWCPHIGGFGPPFPYCDICEPKHSGTTATHAGDEQQGRDAARALVGKWRTSSNLSSLRLASDIFDRCADELEAALAADQKDRT